MLQEFGIEDALRATPVDPTEEVIFLPEEDFKLVNVEDLTLALMRVLPHTKVWVVASHPLWRTEPL